MQHITGILFYNLLAELPGIAWGPVSSKNVLKL